jgi:hypothetical protein
MSQTRGECKVCRYFDPNVSYPPSGHCKRRAPVIDQRDHQYGSWPWVQDYNWCGEFELKIESQDPQEIRK